MKKKILFFTNNPLSLNNSNGRSLLILLQQFQKSEFEIFNIYIHSGEESDKEIKYIRFSDSDVFKLLLGKKIVAKNNGEIRKKDAKSSIRNIKKTSTTMLMRGILWSSSKVKKYLIKISSDINPDLIVFQVGDSYFFNNLACELRLKLKKPLLLYNTEDYYFKNYDFFKGRNFREIPFIFYKKKYDKSFNRLINLSSCTVFLTEDLEALHKKEFPKLKTSYIHNSYTCSSGDIKSSCDTQYKIVYSGNLEVGRFKTLIKIADVLKVIDSNLCLAIHSQTKETSIIDKLCKHSNILFLGETSYENNLSFISGASLIVHVESFDPFFSKDTKYAFSTKIPDSLHTGKCFLLVAPSTSSTFKYIKNNSCGWTCGDFSLLEEVISEIIELNFINKFKTAAQEISNKNHNPITNSISFLKIVREVLKNG